VGVVGGGLGVSAERQSARSKLDAGNDTALPNRRSSEVDVDHVNSKPTGEHAPPSVVCCSVTSSELGGSGAGDRRCSPAEVVVVDDDSDGCRASDSDDDDVLVVPGFLGAGLGSSSAPAMRAKRVGQATPLRCTACGDSFRVMVRFTCTHVNNLEEAPFPS
jgi:hypothetical protein